MKQIELKSSTHKLAFIAIFAASYFVLVSIFPFLSFLQLNIRISNVLIGLAPFFPVETSVAYALGTFLSNFQSPLGLLDMLSFIPILLSMLLSIIVYKKSVLAGMILQTVILTTWLTYLLSTVLNIPWEALAPYLLIGNIISNTVLPYALFKALKTRIVVTRPPDSKSG